MPFTHVSKKMPILLTAHSKYKVYVMLRNLINRVYFYFFPKEKTPVVTDLPVSVVETIPRKKLDTYQLSEHQINLILSDYAVYKANLKTTGINDFDSYVATWNILFGCSKSKRTYYRIIKKGLTKSE